jgi:hypothetical protein
MKHISGRVVLFIGGYVAIIYGTVCLTNRVSCLSVVLSTRKPNKKNCTPPTINCGLARNMCGDYFVGIEESSCITPHMAICAFTVANQQWNGRSHHYGTSKQLPSARLHPLMYISCFTVSPIQHHLTWITPIKCTKTSISCQTHPSTERQEICEARA